VRAKPRWAGIRGEMPTGFRGLGLRRASGMRASVLPIQLTIHHTLVWYDAWTTPYSRVARWLPIVGGIPSNRRETQGGRRRCTNHLIRES